MNEIYFNEEQLGNPEIIGQALFDEDPSDPRSWSYKRNLIRPAVHWWRIILFAAVVIGITVCLYFLLIALKLPSYASVLICIATASVILMVHLRRILICIVRIYQRFAPTSLRNKCRFEPSCSQYMILSLQKYGLVKGLLKGINRLKRCNTGDGGFDYP